MNAQRDDEYAVSTSDIIDRAVSIALIFYDGDEKKIVLLGASFHASHECECKDAYSSESSVGSRLTSKAKQHSEDAL